jgi:hypothetical protein
LRLLLFSVAEMLAARPSRQRRCMARKLGMNGKKHIQNSFPTTPRGDFFPFRSRFAKGKRGFL